MNDSAPDIQPCLANPLIHANDNRSFIRIGYSLLSEKTATIDNIIFVMILETPMPLTPRLAEHDIPETKKVSHKTFSIS